MHINYDTIIVKNFTTTLSLNNQESCTIDKDRIVVH